MIKYKIVSDSMSPLISIGDELIVEKIPDNYRLKRFDIILYKNKNKYMCHYFWYRNKNYDQTYILTRNLKNGHFDYPFEIKNVVGIVKNFKISFYQKLKIMILDKFLRL